MTRDDAQAVRRELGVGVINDAVDGYSVTKNIGFPGDEDFALRDRMREAGYTAQIEPRAEWPFEGKLVVR